MPSLVDARIRLSAAVFAMCLSTGAFAQITHGSGAGNAESRASDSTSRADPSGNTVHESHAPQSKDAAGKQRGSGSKDKNSGGAGGFENGLYGTGAGSNKK